MIALPTNDPRLEVTPSRCAPVFYHGTGDIFNCWVRFQSRFPGRSEEVYAHMQEFLNANVASSHSIIQHSNSSRKFLSKLASLPRVPVSKYRHVHSLARLVPTPRLVAIQQNTLCATTINPQGGRETKSQEEIALAVSSDGFRDRFPAPL